MDSVLCITEASQFQEVSFIPCSSYCLCYWNSTQEVVSCADMLQTYSKFLFYQVHCGQINIEVLNAFVHEVCAW